MEIRDGDDFTGCSHEQEVGGQRESDRKQLRLESEILEKFVSKNEKPEELENHEAMTDENVHLKHLLESLTSSKMQPGPLKHLKIFTVCQM